MQHDRLRESDRRGSILAWVGGAGAPARRVSGVLPGPHQQIELAPLHLVLEQPEARLLANVEYLVDTVNRFSQLGCRPFILGFQRSESIANRGLIVGTG